MHKLKLKYLFLLAVAVAMACVQSCKPKTETVANVQDSVMRAPKIATTPFGKLPGGEAVTQYTLVNKNGVEMKVINYGAIITALKTPDKNGVLEDIVLGFDSLSSYLAGTPYFGAVVGRYGNRIANGKFTIDGTTYSVAQNNNGQHLHGGLVGYDKVFWNAEEVESAEGTALKLSYVSKDMEEGYPGNLTISVVYTLTDANELKIDYRAVTDKKTVVNLTQHSYFNLTGNVKRDILDHEVVIHADKLVPVNKVLIPTGKLQDVTNTPFDFRTATKVGARINVKDEQLANGLGYDHCWVLSSSDSLKLAASVYEPTSGRYMEVRTTEPGIQFYCGNFLDGTLVGKGGVTYKHRYGLCLETEHFPDSPNQATYPSVVLSPGEAYATTTIYTFGAK